LRKRIIPVLLIKDKGLVKGVNFRNHKYVGDPINTVKIFNDKEVDELIVLDILATENNRCIDLELVKALADECFMPFTAGGGITNINQIKEIIRAGAEKVSLNSTLSYNPSLIRDASRIFGRQSIVVSVDINKNWFGGLELYSNCYKTKIKKTLVNWLKELEKLGAGEVLINCIHKDGLMEGYDLSLINEIASYVSIPIIILGGAGKYDDLRYVFTNSDVSAAAAGSLFVFHGNLRAVLINYPTKDEQLSIYGIT